MQLAIPIKDSSDWTFLLFTSPAKLIASKKECKSDRQYPSPKQRRKWPQPQVTNYEAYKPNAVKSEGKQLQKLKANLYLLEY